MEDSMINSSVEEIEYDYLIKFLIVGDSQVGKTTFCFQYTNGEFNPKFVSTIGIDISNTRLTYKPKASSTGKSYKIHLELWDTSGQERFRSLTTAFFRDGMGFILMFDVTSEESFLNIENWLTLIRSNAYCEAPVAILVGTKIDRQDDRVISETRAKELADTLSLPYIEISALTAENVTETIETLLERVLVRMEQANDKSIFPVEQRGQPLPPLNQKEKLFTYLLGKCICGGRRGS